MASSSVSREARSKPLLAKPVTVEWATPWPLFNRLNASFNFTLDPCAAEWNHKCERYFTIEQDGLKQSWAGERVFMNPPYGDEIGKWMQKAVESVNDGATVVALIPGRSDTIWWHTWVEGKATKLIRLKGRVHFVCQGEPKDNPSFPSIVAIYLPTFQ